MSSIKPPLLSLPEDVQLQIAAFVPFEMPRICKRLYRLCQDPYHVNTTIQKIDCLFRPILSSPEESPLSETPDLKGRLSTVQRLVVTSPFGSEFFEKVRASSASPSWESFLQINQWLKKSKNNENQNLLDIWKRVSPTAPREIEENSPPNETLQAKADRARTLWGRDSFSPWSESLTELDLSNLNLFSLPNELITFSSITSLNVSNNSLPKLDKKICLIMGTWETLEHIDFSSNIINELPKEVGLLTHLKTAIFQRNLLSQLPEEVGAWTEIESVDFSQNCLTSLPRAVGQWIHLKKAIFKTNQLSAIPSEVGAWKALEEASFGSNNLRELPVSIEHWRKLKSGFFTNNCLTSLPSGVFGWTRLQKLALAKNNIRQLSQQIQNLRELLVLDLTGNDLSTLPNEIVTLVKLEKLWIQFNKLRQLPQNLQRLTALRLLNVSANRLQALPSQSELPPHLTTYIISHNPVSRSTDCKESVAQ